MPGAPAQAFRRSATVATDASTHRQQSGSGSTWPNSGNKKIESRPVLKELIFLLSGVFHRLSALSRRVVAAHTSSAPLQQAVAWAG